MVKFAKFYDALLENLLIVLFTGMIILMFTEVVARHVFNNPIIWSEELGRMIFIYCVFLGASVAFLRKSHIAVDYFTQFMPPSLKWPAEVTVNLLVIAVLLFVLYYGFQWAWKSFDEPAYSIDFVNLGWSYLAVPLGALTMLVNLFRSLFRKDQVN